MSPTQSLWVFPLRPLVHGGGRGRSPWRGRRHFRYRTKGWTWTRNDLRTGVGSLNGESRNAGVTYLDYSDCLASTSEIRDTSHNDTTERQLSGRHRRWSSPWSGWVSGPTLYDVTTGPSRPGHLPGLGPGQTRPRPLDTTTLDWVLRGSRGPFTLEGLS